MAYSYNYSGCLIMGVLDRTCHNILCYFMDSNCMFHISYFTQIKWTMVLNIFCASICCVALVAFGVIGALSASGNRCTTKTEPYEYRRNYLYRETTTNVVCQDIGVRLTNISIFFLYFQETYN